MGEPKRFGELEVSYDPAHEEREWIVQRVSWVLMAVTALAALAGLLGPGPLSKVKEGTTGARLRVEYDRFARYQAPGNLRIFCRPVGETQFTLSFDRAYIEQTEIKEISPEPASTVADGARYSYLFNRGRGEEQLVTLRFESQVWGKASTTVTLEGGDSAEVKQFYWP